MFLVIVVIHNTLENRENSQKLQETLEICLQEIIR